MSCTSNKLPLTYDLCYYRGDTYRRTIRLRELNEDGTPGDPYDLTGCTVLAQVRQYYDGDVISTVSTVVDPDQVNNKGCINLELDTNMETMGGDFAVWDMEVTWPSGDKTTYLKGRVIAQLDVSYV